MESLQLGRGYHRQDLAKTVVCARESPVNPEDVVFSEDKFARGYHKLITFETGIVPRSVEFKDHFERIEDRTLLVTVSASALEPEALRIPPPEDESDTRTPEERAAELFPQRRARAVSKEEFEDMLDELLNLPFEVEIVAD